MGFRVTQIIFVTFLDDSCSKLGSQSVLAGLGNLLCRVSGLAVPQGSFPFSWVLRFSFLFVP